nr:hypothetical protein [Thermoproteota archaeon]
PPTLIVPEDIVVESTSEQGAVVRYTVTAQDNVDGTATLDENNILTQDNTVYANVDGTAPMPGGGSTGTMTPTPTPAPPPPAPPNAPVGGGDITIDCDPPSGSLFEIGETPVECTAIDSFGNTEVENYNVVCQQSLVPLQEENAVECEIATRQASGGNEQANTLLTGDNEATTTQTGDGGEGETSDAEGGGEEGEGETSDD